MRLGIQNEQRQVRRSIPASQIAGRTAFPAHRSAGRAVCFQGADGSDGQVIAMLEGSFRGYSTAPYPERSLPSIRRPTAGECVKPAITIRTDGDVWIENIDRSDTLVKECHLSKQEIIEKIKEAGIVACGGEPSPHMSNCRFRPGSLNVLYQTAWNASRFLRPTTGSCWKEARRSSRA